MDLTPPISTDSRGLRRGDHDLALEALRSLPTALLVVCANGITLLANRRACAALQRSRSEIEGEPVSAYLAPLETLLSPAAHDERSAKLDVRLPTDRMITVGFAVSRMRRHDDATEEQPYVIVLKDLSDVERLREERDRLLQIATVHEVLPAILHEVKNPLAAVATTAELLVEEAADDHVKSSAHAILQEARRMKLTLEGIGAVGRKLRSDRLERVDLGVREACAVLRVRAESLGLVTRFSVPVLPPVALDTSVLCALVFNLITNSIQACRTGGVIGLAVRLDRGGGELEVEVEDDGAGMTPEVLARCRELFFTTKVRGTGIGLALCERAVTEAGAVMDIDSSPGKGTRITLRIPLDPAGDRPADTTRDKTR